MIYLHKYHHGQWQGAVKVRRFRDAERTEIELLRVHAARGWNYELSTSPVNPLEGKHDHNDGRQASDANGATPDASGNEFAVNPA